LITIENLPKYYGSFCAVNNLSFQVGKGEIFGFLGINGAGKTTTLRMLTGILQPSSGNIFLGKYNLAKDPIPAKQIVGYIPDRPYLYNKLSAREFLYFCAELYNVPVKEIDYRIDALLEEYSLKDWQNELVESYSHGMKQRLATCAALIHKPEILIIDEPMVGLDPHGAKMLKDALRRYSEAGTTILLSTHSLNVAEELANRLGIIHRGQLIATGTLNEIKELSATKEERLESLFLELTTQVQ
jgi:ABC-2 type transport system ATP-binding protein